MRPYLIVFLFELLSLLFFGAIASDAVTQTSSLQLLGRSNVDHYNASIKEADWRWLRHKSKLRLGISSPDYPPFDITSNGRNYEGLTADYVQLLSQLLHVPIEILRFDSRTEVIQALKEGEIDFLGTANGYEESDESLELSASYSDDQPTFVIRRDDQWPSQPLNLAGKKIAMLYHYLPPGDVRKFYTDSDIQVFSSTLGAIGAVAFGTADAYLGDAISANYLISRNYLSNVQLAGFSSMEGSRFAFAVRRGDSHLLRVINAALVAIPLNERLGILRRWGGSEISIPGQQLLQFTAKEQRWISEHPRVKVAVVQSFLPMSFFDDQGSFRGISAEVLAKISLRTGLHFDIVRSDSLPGMVELLRNGNTDLLAAITPSAEREKEMLFTRPYVSAPYVLVSRTQARSPRVLEEMSKKKLALIKGNVLHEFIVSRYPQIDIVEADSAAQAMELLATGKVDGAINSLFSARYLISRQYRDRLQISSTVGDIPARVSLATGLGALELYSILEKALLSISPEEMGELAKRWQGDVGVDESYWLRNRAIIIKGFAISGLLLLLALGWITYLRKLIGRREVAETALINQLEFMRVLIDGTPHPIYVRDRDGCMLVCNTAYLELFDLEREEAIGKRLTESPFADPFEAEAFHDEYLKVMTDGRPRIKDRTVTLPDRTIIAVYHWMLPYRDVHGAVIGLIAGWIDISERQRLLEMVEDARKMADSANRAKTTFLATMSHEIRTPMNAVIGMLELALKKADQGLLDRFAVEVASGAALGLQELIGDILDIARIESGKLSLSPERTNFRELIETLVRVFEGVAHQKHLQLSISLDVPTGDDVLADPHRLKQIISNLLSNAIKFTDAGEVRLILEMLPSSTEDHLSVRLTVEDSGMGISNEDQKLLFSPFTQASNNNQSPRAGSGLGLAISRTLCEMMGGTLRLHSELGKGTAVEMLLELPRLKPLGEKGVPEADLQLQCRALNILVVDDYLPNRLLLSKQLGYLGHNVIEAGEGADGLRLWRQHVVDAVITDCNMPIMDGYALARAIRVEEQEHGQQSCFVMGFTANAQPDEKERCLSAGMDDCLFKPISLKVLEARLALAFAMSPAADVDGSHVADGQTAAIGFGHLDQLFGGNPEAMRELLDGLAQSNKEELARLPQIFFEQNIQGLLDLAHKIKGAARIVRDDGVIAACERLEVLCESELDEEALEVAVSNLSAEMTRLELNISAYQKKH